MKVLPTDVSEKDIGEILDIWKIRYPDEMNDWLGHNVEVVIGQEPGYSTKVRILLDDNHPRWIYGSKGGVESFKKEAVSGGDCSQSCGGGRDSDRDLEEDGVGLLLDVEEMPERVDY